MTTGDGSLLLKVDEAKTFFFDSAKVIRALDGARRRVLSKAGAFVRARAISLILRHKVSKGFGAKSKITNRAGSSAPGQPPFAHTGELARFLFFAWDPATRSVVVGPAKLNKPTIAPEVLEHGGEETIRLPGKRLADGRRGPVIVRRASYQARPFMRPALDAEAPKLAPMFAGQVR